MLALATDSKGPKADAGESSLKGPVAMLQSFNSGAWRVVKRRHSPVHEGPDLNWKMCLSKIKEGQRHRSPVHQSKNRHQASIVALLANTNRWRLRDKQGPEQPRRACTHVLVKDQSYKAEAVRNGE